MALQRTWAHLPAHHSVCLFWKAEPCTGFTNCNPETPIFNTLRRQPGHCAALRPHNGDWCLCRRTALGFEYRSTGMTSDWARLPPCPGSCHCQLANTMAQVQSEQQKPARRLVFTWLNNTHSSVFYDISRPIHY